MNSRGKKSEYSVVRGHFVRPLTPLQLLVRFLCRTFGYLGTYEINDQKEPRNAATGRIVASDFADTKRRFGSYSSSRQASSSFGIPVKRRHMTVVHLQYKRVSQQIAPSCPKCITDLKRCNGFVSSIKFSRVIVFTNHVVEVVLYSYYSLKQFREIREAERFEQIISGGEGLEAVCHSMLRMWQCIVCRPGNCHRTSECSLASYCL